MRKTRRVEDIYIYIYKIDDQVKKNRRRTLLAGRYYYENPIP